MTCYVLDKNTGGFICGDFGPPCECGMISTLLCDYPVGDGKTCDKRICEHCSTNIAPEVDYCEGHFKEWQEFRDAGGVKRELENVVPWPKRDAE